MKNIPKSPFLCLSKIRKELSVMDFCSYPQSVRQWPCGVVVARLPHTQEDPGSTPGRGSYLRQVSLH